MPFDVAHFVTLDRQDDRSRAGVEISKLFLAESSSFRDTTNALRFDVHGQWFDSEHNAGAYVTVPISYAGGTYPRTTALGDIELGGMLVESMGEHSVLVLHAGVTLPTQSSSGQAAEVARLDAYARVADDYLTIPGGASLRLGASPIVRSGNVFARGDFGVDAAGTSDTVGAVPTILRLDAGVGAVFGPAAVMAESTNLFTGSSFGEPVHSFAVAARCDAGSIQLYSAFIVMNTALTVGIEARLP